MSVQVLNVLLGAGGRWEADESAEPVVVASLEKFEAVSATVHFADGARALTLYLARPKRGYVKVSDLSSTVEEDDEDDE